MWMKLFGLSSSLSPTAVTIHFHHQRALFAVKYLFFKAKFNVNSFFTAEMLQIFTASYAEKSSKADLIEWC